MINFGNCQSFTAVHDFIRHEMKQAPLVKTERWQGVTANQSTRELRNVVYEVDLQGITDITHWEEDIKPNLPWARDHFLERVGGEPLNPGEQWKNWPWGKGAAGFVKEQRFNHTYAERLWPRYARRTADGRLPHLNRLRKYPGTDNRPKMGIAFSYGDLQDLVDLLVKEPHTRQAWIPLFFPEDTGVGDGGRKPCTLGYGFLVRENRCHMYYPLRSCDFVRHWADDCYLAVRLLLWVVETCWKESFGGWDKIKPGTLAMHMTSLHIFEGDQV